MKDREIRVINYLRGKDFVSLKEIKEGTGLGEKTLRKALDSLLKEGKVELKEEKGPGAIIRKFYKLNIETVSSEVSIEEEVKEQKETQGKNLVIKVNNVKVLEIENITGDVNQVCTDILKMHFGENINYNIEEKGNCCEVNISMNFGRKG